MSEPSSSAPAQLEGLALEACEWLPSSDEAGLLRVRARWTHEPGDAELPWLWIRSSGTSHRFDSLPDTRFARGSGVWRATYLVPAGLVTDGPDALWLAWPSGLRVALPAPARDAAPLPGSSAPPSDSSARSPDPRSDVSARPSDASLSPSDAPASPPDARGEGGELIDHAVLADRRARRAEASEREQARAATGALRAVELLEQRVEALRRERDELASAAAARESPRGEELTGARACAEAAERRLSHSREALSAALAAGARLRGQAREWRLHLRTSELVRSGEAAMAARERARLEHDARLSEAAAAEGELRERLASERRAQEAAHAALAERERELAGLQGQLAEVRHQLESAAAQASAREAQLEQRLRALDDALAAERRALVASRGELESVRARLAAAEAIGRAEAVARAALDEQLDRERATRRALATALQAAREAPSELRAELEAARAEAATLHGSLATLGAELAAAREAGEAAHERAMRLEGALGSARAAADDARTRVATLRAAVAAAHRAHAAERAQLAGLEADLAAERARRLALERQVAAVEGQGGSLTTRIAAPDHRADGLGDALELQRQAREQAEAASLAAAPEAAQVQRVAADLDAAAAALRARMPAPGDVETRPRDEGVQAEPAEAPLPDAAEPAEPPLPDAAEPAEAPLPDAPEPAGPAVSEGVEPAPVEVPVGERGGVAPVEAPVGERGGAAPVEAPVGERGGAAQPDGGPPAEDATVRHRLRGALVRLAREDPATAGRILVGLLPAQAPALPGGADYDVTIGGAGTYAVTVACGRTDVRPLSSPRGRRRAEFHLRGDARSLAELLAGSGPRVRRFSGPVRASGRRRRARPVLEALAGSRQSLTEAVRAGARLDADLLVPALPHAVDPAWVRGHTFTVEHRTGDSTWYLVARDAGGLTVTRTAPDHPPDATVTVTPEAFQRLLRGDPVPHGERPSVRGDRVAVELLRRWMDGARGLQA